MATQKLTFGELPCYLVEPESTAELLVVFCHGYGAPGQDLVPLSWEIAGQFSALRDKVAWLFPTAPHAIDDGGFGGRAWWPLNVAQMIETLAGGDLNHLSDQCPPELPDVRATVRAALDAAMQRFDLTPPQLVLGGFSQGAMVAADAALHLPESPALLCMLSGALLCRQQWTPRLKQSQPPPVFQSHGQYDSVLPFVLGTNLRDWWQSADVSLEFIEFAGDHTIPPDVIQRLAFRLLSLLPS